MKDQRIYLARLYAPRRLRKPKAMEITQRENYHGLKMAEPEFVWGHHALRARATS